MAKAVVTETKLLCPLCGTIHTIYRRACKLKKAGHYKNYYCYKCKDQHNHIELKTEYFYSAEEIQALIEKMKEEGKFDEKLKEDDCDEN